MTRTQTYNSWETLSFSTKAEEKGFVSASIRGTSSEPAKFDDFSIQLKSLYSAKLYQENHYYPFGMNMKGLENSDKQTQQNKAAHEFQFNAQTEREESFGLFWDETPFRNYDMQLGRLWGVDKLAELIPMVSPSQYAYNNPILFNDPSGLIGETFVANSPARTTKSYDPNANSAYIFQAWAEAGGGGSEIDRIRKGGKPTVYINVHDFSNDPTQSSYIYSATIEANELLKSYGLAPNEVTGEGGIVFKYISGVDIMSATTLGYDYYGGSIIFGSNPDNFFSIVNDFANYHRVSSFGPRRHKAASSLSSWNAGIGKADYAWTNFIEVAMTKGVNLNSLGLNFGVMSSKYITERQSRILGSTQSSHSQIAAYANMPKIYAWILLHVIGHNSGIGVHLKTPAIMMDGDYFDKNTPPWSKVFSPTNNIEWILSIQKHFLR